MVFSWCASRTKKSSLPARESASISLSHCSQSFSDSYRKSSANSSLASPSISALSSSIFDMVFPSNQRRESPGQRLALHPPRFSAAGCKRWLGSHLLTSGKPSGSSIDSIARSTSRPGQYRW